MLWIFALVLTALWIAGVVARYTIGGLIHILLGLAIVLVIIRLVKAPSRL